MAGATVRDIPDGQYRWIKRACNSTHWRGRIKAAIETLRQRDPSFGVPRPTWNNDYELHRRKNYPGWQPISQGTVATTGRYVLSASNDAGYWKEDDSPGPLNWRRPRSRAHKICIGCDGFRANFQGAYLREQQQAAANTLRYGISSVIREYDLPPESPTSVMRSLQPRWLQKVRTPRHYSSGYYWQKLRTLPDNPGGGGSNQLPPQTWDEWRKQLNTTYPEVSATYNSWKLPTIAFGGLYKLP